MRPGFGLIGEADADACDPDGDDRSHDIKRAARTRRIGHRGPLRNRRLDLRPGIVLLFGGSCLIGRLHRRHRGLWLGVRLFGIMLLIGIGLRMDRAMQMLVIRGIVLCTEVLLHIGLFDRRGARDANRTCSQARRARQTPVLFEHGLEGIFLTAADETGEFGQRIFVRMRSRRRRTAQTPFEFVQIDHRALNRWLTHDSIPRNH